MHRRKPSKGKMYPVPITIRLALRDSPSANLGLSRGAWRRQRPTPTVGWLQAYKPYHACGNRTDLQIPRRGCALDDDADGARHG